MTQMWLSECAVLIGDVQKPQSKSKHFLKVGQCIYTIKQQNKWHAANAFGAQWLQSCEMLNWKW